MSYTAIKRMHDDNIRRFGRDLGPAQPPLYCTADHPNDLKSSALRFLHNRCEELLFDPEIENEEIRSGTYRGRSLKSGQIPYNMEMDINRLSLEKALEAFFDSGIAEDAYVVYYCYLEMFFGPYGRSKHMVELLSEYESNGSSLLLKHRDHYSHSVYVFALGLALFENSESYRRSFASFYALEDSECAQTACRFLHFWGLASLFHDIGYPFELPFEQVLSYFEVENQERGEGSLFLSYQSVGTLTDLSEAAAGHFLKLFGRAFASSTDLMAWDIQNKLGAVYGTSEETLRAILESKPTHPDRFGYFMDHALFSAARLYQELEKALGAERITQSHVDVLTAIVLHNSLYKFSIAFYKDPDKRKPTLSMDLHPLAWLLMLCDELQCWDRTAYGRNSRTELHPMAADFDFTGGAVSAVYYYDQEEQDKIDAFLRQYRHWEEGGEQGKPPRLKAYSDMAEKEARFVKDINAIVNLSSVPLTVTPSVRQADRKRKHTYLSTSSFLHLYDFAVALNGRYLSAESDPAELESMFESLSLEYQIANINQAKSFSRYLNAIHCFYSDRPVDFEMVRSFDSEQTSVFAPLEHERWLREHQAMGWRSGTAYQEIASQNPSCSASDLREQLRMHALALDSELTEELCEAHYRSLPEEEQGKDWEPFCTMLQLLKKFDGLRIYHLSGVNV
ncbi:MAG: hypothetical protein J6P31_06325 [Oscillospiraceae bacterium]|nr:hypothetical protein [Oscillospiraceae bacterium]